MAEFDEGPPRLFVGSEAGGIVSYVCDPVNGRLRELMRFPGADRSTHLVVDRANGLIYSLRSDEDGRIDVFGWEDGRLLRKHAGVPTAGAGPCWLCFLGRGALAVANYWGGSTALHRVDPGGIVRPAHQVLHRQGKGADPRRQDRSHPHAVVEISGTNRVVIADLGTDELVSYERDARSGTLVEESATASYCGSGRGPRSVVLQGDGRALVVNELSGTLTMFKYIVGAGQFVKLCEVSTVLAGGEDEVYPAVVSVSADGRFAYVGNRGRDSVTTFAVRSASLTVIAEVSVHGRWPIDLRVMGDWLYVANQHSGNVVVLPIDSESGIPGAPIQTLDVPGASCLAAV